MGDTHGVGESQRRRLLDVGDAYAEPRSVADRLANFGAGLADDDADVADARGGQRLDGVEEDRAVGDGNELLGAGVRDGTQPRSLAAAEDEPFHRDMSARFIVATLSGA